MPKAKTRRQLLKEVEASIRKFVYPGDLDSYKMWKFFATYSREHNMCLTLFIQLNKKGYWSVISETPHFVVPFISLKSDIIDNDHNISTILSGLIGLGILSADHMDAYYSFIEYRKKRKDFLDDFQTVISFLSEFKINVNRLEEESYIDNIKQKYLRTIDRQWKKGDKL